MHIQRMKKNDPETIKLTDVVLEIYCDVIDILEKHKADCSAKRIENAFLVAVGHLIYTFAARRGETTDTPISRYLEEFSAVIEMNGMELHTEIQRHIKERPNGR